MNKIIKYLLIGIPLFLIIGLSFIILNSYFEHKSLIETEKEMYPPVGNLVDCS